MTALWKKALKPVFALVAKPGIGNPHTHIRDNMSAEGDLMAVGAKPVAIIGAGPVSAKMQEAIDNGSVVHIGDSEGKRPHRIYCHPDEIEEARRVATVFELHRDGEDFTEAESDIIFSVVGQSRDSNEISFSDGGHELYKAIMEGRTTPSIDALLAGNLKALPPAFYLEGYPKHEVLEMAVAEGKIAAVDYEDTVLARVFAQADKVEEGRELYARSFKQEEGYEASASVQQYHRRIGQLLGYTENDIAWSSGEKYQNPLVHGLMKATMDIRRWCRVEVMLMEAEEKVVNMAQNKPFQP